MRTTAPAHHHTGMRVPIAKDLEVMADTGCAVGGPSCLDCRLPACVFEYGNDAHGRTLEARLTLRNKDAFLREALQLPRLANGKAAHGAVKALCTRYGIYPRTGRRWLTAAGFQALERDLAPDYPEEKRQQFLAEYHALPTTAGGRKRPGVVDALCERYRVSDRRVRYWLKCEARERGEHHA